VRVPLTSLSLHSEPYAPTGNIGDSGFRKLLGTPSLDLMQTVVREAVQNCCDADKDGKGPVIHIRLRALNAEQKAFVAEHAFTELPTDPQARKAFGTFFEAPAPLVLEICDFNTTGLGGPTRADRLASEEDPTDFIDFFRNVGKGRDTALGGGTYGFGKVSLYIASRCATILVDTQTDRRTRFERRLMGCHLGAAESRRQQDGSLRRYTGRHWWGVLAENGQFAEPLRGASAREFSEKVGFPRRDDTDSGTSIMIVDPHIGDEGPELAIRRIAETLLWNFWPRMMATTPDSKRLKIRIFLDQTEIQLPQPETFPPLDLFCQAMNRLREAKTGTETISSLRPAKDLGRLSITEGLRAGRAPLVYEDSLFPSRSCHIAVMRPVELVVRYFEGDPLPDERMEWAGVFVTSSETEVERAFADAEPPAHDDWQPDMMAKGPARTYVRVAIKEIRRRAKEVGALAAGQMNPDGSGESLAVVARRLGSLLDSGLGHGAGGSRPVHGRPAANCRGR